LKVIAAPMMFASVPSTGSAFDLAPGEKAALRAFIKAEGICGVVVLSGDTHWGGAWDLLEGGGLLEFAASPFQALPFPGSSSFLAGNERGNAAEGEKQLFYSSFGFHYGTLDVEKRGGEEEEEPGGRSARATVRIFKFWPWHEQATMVYEKALDVAALCPSAGG
jgi:hypothetical protein